jgi:putative hydrolase of the HAD superfamily
VSEPRAIIFDLDDTLYPLRHFVRSGFGAVADVVAREVGVTRDELVAILRDARRWAPGQELQCLCGHFGLPASDVERFVNIVRAHWPDIRLPRETVRVLAELQPDWRIGVLTNGRADTQRRKAAALGLTEYVDAVIFASECGDGRGKPDRAPFVAILDALDVPADRAVFVGDDLDADIFGASQVGMRAIHVNRDGWRGVSRTGVRPDARVQSLGSVPRVAARLVEGERRVHAA